VSPPRSERIERPYASGYINGLALVSIQESERYNGVENRGLGPAPKGKLADIKLKRHSLEKTVIRGPR
jgi:hypothetical protein